jgi:hypothetical protein
MRAWRLAVRSLRGISVSASSVMTHLITRNEVAGTLKCCFAPPAMIEFMQFAVYAPNPSTLFVRIPFGSR